MRASRLLGVVVLAAAIGLPSMAASGSTPKNYPLGHAKSCKAHFSKKTEHHKVGGREVRYVECVYEAPSRNISTTTTTTLPLRSVTTTTQAPQSSSSSSSTTSTTSTTTTTTTIPYPPTIRPSISGVSASEGDTVCGTAYCYDISLSINTLGWPDPMNPPVHLGSVTLTWGSGGTGGSAVIPVTWNGFGINLDTTAGISHGVTEIDASYSGGTYTDTQGGQVTIYSGTSSGTP